MSENQKNSGSLLAKEATGGEIAEDGFSFQNGMLLSRLPLWLAQGGFSQMIREALGDTEARFFVPGRGDCREFNEYKNHRLTPSEFWPEIDHFRKIDNQHPDAYRLFRLVCSDVNQDLQPLCRALDRARRTLPFYDGVSSIENETFEELADRIMKEGERDRSYAEFVFKKVWINFEAPRQTNQNSNSFRDNFEREFPESADLKSGQIRSLQAALSNLITSKIAAPISRSEILSVIRETLPGFELATLNSTKIYTASEPEETWKEHRALFFDWSRFSGQGSRIFPEKSSWDSGLDELIQTRNWIIENKAPRHIQLQGTRRLSASVAFGSTFSATGGFVIETENHGEIFTTDQHSGPTTTPYKWNIEHFDNDQTDEIAVVVSVKRKIVTDVQSFLTALLPIAVTLHSSDAMISADQINLAVEQVKEEISSAISNNNAKVIHLFLAVPSSFALFLGHRLNATCNIQCYEHVGSSNYVPTFRINCK